MSGLQNKKITNSSTEIQQHQSTSAEAESGSEEERNLDEEFNQQSNYEEETNQEPDLEEDANQQENDKSKEVVNGEISNVSSLEGKRSKTCGEHSSLQIKEGNIDRTSSAQFSEKEKSEGITTESAKMKTNFKPKSVEKSTNVGKTVPQIEKEKEKLHSSRDFTRKPERKITLENVFQAKRSSGLNDWKSLLLIATLKSRMEHVTCMTHLVIN